jgi:hypothetical protein
MQRVENGRHIDRAEIDGAHVALTQVDQRLPGKGARGARHVVRHQFVTAQTERLRRR